MAALQPARIQSTALAALMVLLAGLPDQTRADSQAAWREEAGRIRVLAENDAPAAYEAAKQLQANLPPDATASDRARALNLLARIETYLALTEPAAAHARQAFELAAANGDRVGQAEADLNVTLNAINQGKLDDLVTAAQHSVTVLEGVDRPDLLGEAMLRTAVMYRRFDQFDESVSVAVQAMQIAQRGNNPLALAYAHQGLAMALEQSYQFAEARAHTEQMRVQARAAHSRLLEAFAVAGLAGAKGHDGDLRGAEQLTREALAMYREVGVPFATSFGLYQLADRLSQQGRHQQALQYLDEAIDIYKRYPNPIGVWFALNGRSADYQALGDIARANADAERAYQVARHLGLALYLSGSATRLASIAAAKGDYHRAYALSNEASEMTAKASREKAGQRMVQLIKRYESESKQRQIDELTRRSEQQIAELRQRTLQQRWLWTVLASLIAALAGTVLFVFRQRQSQRREAALSEARQLARHRSEFLTQMSHELRTPLNAILGFAQILRRHDALSERQARGLKIIDESGQHLLTLIDDILDLARIDAARLELFAADIDLPSFLQVVCEIIRVKADDKGLLFEYQAAPDLPATVRVDRKRLRQVLLNLLSNAVKFSDKGQVTLRVRRAVPSAPEAASDATARLHFEVEDQGIGMSRAQLERLFQPFEQVADASRREGGTGLGLAISRELIRLMGADIQVRSQPGQGSVFWFEIEVPASQIPLRAVPEQGPPVGYLGERRTILVVDDVAQSRTMLLDSFSALGFQVAEAADGAQALDVAARVRPDLIVMDLTMPVMDGFEATRRLRQTADCATLPIVATSASVTGETEARAREAGANAFIGKPIQRAELLNSIAGLLGLTWIHEAAAEALTVTQEADDDRLVPPPPEEISVLRGLARLGNMRSICERADHVQGLDPKYAPFAARLRLLAQGYQSKAITAMIERYAIVREPPARS
jgi:signal transduction histidine kinase/DNA-binding NarL/FixJ family response regulator/tetratricopeptide (TPR) repeat protein